LGIGNGAAAPPPNEFCVDLVLNNSQAIKGVQAAVIDVPDEFQLSRVTCTSRTTSFSCQGNEVASTNRINVVVLDLAGSCIPTGTGPIAQICLKDRLPQCPSGNSVQLSIDPASVQAANCSNQPCAMTLVSGTVTCS